MNTIDSLSTAKAAAARIKARLQALGTPIKHAAALEAIAAAMGFTDWNHCAAALEPAAAAPAARRQLPALPVAFDPGVARTLLMFSPGEAKQDAMASRSRALAGAHKGTIWISGEGGFERLAAVDRVRLLPVRVEFDAAGAITITRAGKLQLDRQEWVPHRCVHFELTAGAGLGEHSERDRTLARAKALQNLAIQLHTWSSNPAARARWNAFSLLVLDPLHTVLPDENAADEEHGLFSYTLPLLAQNRELLIATQVAPSPAQLAASPFPYTIVARNAVEGPRLDWRNFPLERRVLLPEKAAITW